MYNPHLAGDVRLGLGVNGNGEFAPAEAAFGGKSAHLGQDQRRRARGRAPPGHLVEAPDLLQQLEHVHFDSHRTYLKP
jgi:hypothetical protein